ncbi:crotonobetainyl-CoA dehydrogenase [Cellulomonas denverensis]|uniref:Crotonobetainyl-CoA dehydrogenase n=1 Tax=Cellulomonas denverensis TaxID=264297 RepID=A0A7X6KWK6_9CELL|nr:crotonobetainyl-CoA dehydrogenase [Cellulomonas denverensis]NKY23353.1 crotonobetainyl-CoA dehydrogenase [Cellulomonas denverensis]GIG24358.1 crotonobetainyl-CoA dehydrogenase [Cellulomonas denverensis]
MDFRLTEDQDLMVQAVRELMAQENWEPYFAECDAKHEYPQRFVQALCELGIDTLLLPESAGGLDAGWTTVAAVWEELGRQGVPTYVLYQLPTLGTVVEVGTPAQQEKILSYLGTGKQIWNFAMTEPGAGSSFAAMSTTYTRRDGKVYLTGHKTFITSSAGVDQLVVMARNAEDMDQYTEWFVDMSLPGITKEPLEKLGLRMDSCCEIYFDQVELREEDMFGQEGQGFARTVADFDLERFLVAACDYGWALCAYEDALRYANQREQGGQAIGRYQLIQDKIARMRIALTNMRNMVFETAWKADNDLLGKGDCSMLKLYCTQAAAAVVDDAIQILGGIAVTGAHRVARFYRDLRVERISGGTDEMMVLTTARAALKEYR